MLFVNKPLGVSLLNMDVRTAPNQSGDALCDRIKEEAGGHVAKRIARLIHQQQRGLLRSEPGAKSG